MLDICLVSIHSLTQRETEDVRLIGKVVGVSIHSLTQRETISGRYYENMKRVSIHSLTQRETLSPFNFVIFKSCFNPLPHAEGDATGDFGRYNL